MVMLNAEKSETRSMRLNRGGNVTMHVMLWLLVSILAAPFAAAASAQEINWEKADAAFGRKPAVSGDVHRRAHNRTGAERGSRLSQYCVPPEETPNTGKFYCRAWGG
jgi:hypothetical protein